MDFYGNTPSLSMNGSSSIATIQNDIDLINNTAVFKAGTQTITGDKTFTGTFEINNNTKDTTIVCDDYSQTSNNYSLNVLGSFVQSVNGIAKLIYGAGNTDYKQGVSHTFYIGAGNPISINSTGLAIGAGYGITSNGLTISDVELGYLDGTTSNIQTQINAKANDNAVVHLAGTETITGTKTFSVNPISATVPTTNSELANKKYVDDTIVAGAFVNIAGTQTITGNKTLQGTTTITGNIISNALTISPTELGYLDGTTSNIQTQINTKANDNAVVHLAGTETITGAKTFTSNTIVAQRTTNNKIELAEANIGLGYTYIDLCSGGNSDYDVRLSSSGGTATLGRGDFTIEAGTIRNYAITSNTLEVNNVVKISTTSTQNTITNTENTITASTGRNIITTASTSASGGNMIENTANSGSNKMLVSGTNATNYIHASNTTGGMNLIHSNKNYFYTISSSGTHIFYIFNANGTSTQDQIVKIDLNNFTVERPIKVRTSPLLSFQIHGCKNGTSTANLVQLKPNYDTSAGTNDIVDYRLPEKIRFVKATLMFDQDIGPTTTMLFHFYTKTTNAGAKTLLHSMSFTTTNNIGYPASQVIDLTGGTPVEYVSGDFFSCAYDVSPASEWGVVFHGYQL